MKSTTQTSIVEKGNTSRGKYTLVSRVLLLNSELIPVLRDVANMFQGKSPQYENTG